MTIHVDDFRPEENPLLQPIVRRIPSGWGRWVSVGEGWLPIVIKLNEDLAAIDPDYEVHQVKEKFGGLRYYCSGDGREEFRTLIRAAEAQCAVTCEVCGEPGELRHGGWVRTLCDTCEAARDK